MGLWLKQDDGSLVEVSGGGGGTFDGDHVLTGDPSDPAVVESVDEGQLLFDGVESDGSGGGPHDHDYLPLEGGTVTGDLTVDGNSDLKINVPADFWSPSSGTVFTDLGMIGGTQGSYAVSMTSNGYRNTGGKWTSMGLNGQAGAVQISLLPTGVFEVRTKGNHPTGSSSNPPSRLTIDDVKTKVIGDLQVDGSATVEQNLAVRGSANFKNTPAANSASRHLWINTNGWMFVADTTRGGPFAPSKLARNSDVLERAETATLPPEPETDDDGNQTNTAEVEAHDTVELFDVVTALMLKVKELSARIEELEGN